MGIEIHAYAEWQNSDDTWVPLMADRDRPWRVDFDRDWRIFDFLAGVGRQRCVPIAANRGLPDDVSPLTTARLDTVKSRVGPAWGYSWVAASELIGYNYLSRLPNANQHVNNYLRHGNYFRILDTLYVLRNHYLMRLVFAFRDHQFPADREPHVRYHGTDDGSPR